MRTTAVLVLTAPGNRQLIDCLLDNGLSPLTRTTMQGALESIKRERLAAVFVDPAQTDVDVLEFILNVRDIDPWVPVLVLSDSGREGAEVTLRQLERTAVLPRAGLLEGLTDPVEQVQLFARE